jgi:hypothetical protein
MIDWSRPTREIAKELGITPAWCSTLRRRYAPETSQKRSNRPFPRPSVYTVGFQCPRSLHRALLEYGLDNDLTTSAVMRQAAEEFLQRRTVSKE